VNYANLRINVELHEKYGKNMKSINVQR